MKDRIKNLIQQYNDRIITYRRKIHQYPELAHEENRTATLVADVLESLGIETMRNVGKTGVVGILRGNMDGPVIALRADMDALPLEEKTNLPFSSKNKGIMHACGHDMHTAILLGTAHILVELKKELKGTVKFIFQPAEENNPIGGAPLMIEEGVLENPRVDAAIALHVWPNLETGTAAIKEGAMMGASDRIFITVYGKSSHGSAPQEGVDAIVGAAQVISSLQTIVSRNIAPLDAAVVSIGTIKGGYRYNVIADRVDLEGTVRNLNPDVRNMMPERIERIVKGVMEAVGGSYEFKYVKGYPPTVNDKDLTKLVFSTLTELLGDKALTPEESCLGGEDFAFFSEKVPSAYIWLGCRNPQISFEDFPPLHNPQFNPDENAIPIGIEILVNTALRYLEGGRR